MNLKQLNENQRKAVEVIRGPLLILAGAGSGKTRVIVYRIAYLLEKAGISPYNILGITFTNKAAEEMRKRINVLVPGKGKGVYISTFHSLCARILREEAGSFGFINKNFVIYDEKDQLSLIKDCFKELNINTQRIHLGAVIESINRAKDNLVDFESYEINTHTSGDYFRQIVSKIYNLYQRKLIGQNACDFGDLILYTVELFQDNPEILEKYQDRFLYIMVDEYQDTNYAQYTLTKLLAKKYRNICVVGDEDQSIYWWRGADFRNILNFENDYKEAVVVGLEKNYRSTKNILNSSCKLISHNLWRKEKQLVSVRKTGKQVVFKEFADEDEEALSIAKKIKKFIQEGVPPQEIAVFYRVNAQSREIENALIKEGIKYKIIGNIQFYKRKEIKDILAYLNVLVNPRDSLSFKRIINIPPRGIGQITLHQLEKFALHHEYSLMDAIKIMAGKNMFKQNTNNIEKFITLIDNYKERIDSFSPTDLVRSLIEEIGYFDYLGSQDIEKIENVKEFVSAVKEYEENNSYPLLKEFLHQISLFTEIDNWDKENGALNLMTLHLAKGLEFQVVFICGLEEGLLPYSTALENKQELEEERRLCYVGMTRAKDFLFLSACSKRRLYGYTHWNRISRFIEEAGIKTEKRIFTKGNTKVPNIWKVGEKVKHPEFGEGVIIERSGDGDDLKIVVMFRNGQWKKFLAKYASLEIIE